MRKLYIFGLIILAGIIIGLAWAEQMTLTTYYPAPYGVYQQMESTITKLVPYDAPPVPSGEEKEGMLYFDKGTAKTKGLYYWDASTSDWVPLGGGAAGVRTIALSATSQEIGGSDIDSPGTEQQMANMNKTLNTQGTKLWVLFAAPFTKVANPGKGEVKLYIDGVAERTLYIKMYLNPNDYVYQGAFHHLQEGLTPGSHTVQIRWQGSGIRQPGLSRSARILTVLDILD